MPDKPTLVPEQPDNHLPATKGDVRAAVEEIAGMTNRAFSEVHDKIDKGFSEMRQSFSEINDSLRDLTGEVRQIRENHEARLQRLERHRPF